MVEEDKVMLEGKEYPVADLSEQGKALFQSLRFVEQEIVQLDARKAVMETARSSYITALQNELPVTNN